MEKARIFKVFKKTFHHSELAARILNSPRCTGCTNPCVIIRWFLILVTSNILNQMGSPYALRLEISATDKSFRDPNLFFSRTYFFNGLGIMSMPFNDINHYQVKNIKTAISVLSFQFAYRNNFKFVKKTSKIKQFLMNRNGKCRGYSGSWAESPPAQTPLSNL